MQKLKIGDSIILIRICTHKFLSPTVYKRYIRHIGKVGIINYVTETWVGVKFSTMEDPLTLYFDEVILT